MRVHIRPSGGQHRGSAPRAALALGISLCTALLTVAACSKAPPVPIDRDLTNPNLILISIDTLRADRLSAYGYHRRTSPNLERFADEAVVFDRFFFSGGGTLPSHMSMMTSLNPLTHGITPENRRTLESERITLAEQLSDAGYVTAGFVDAGWVSGTFGFSQGFDLYDDEGGHFEKILPKVYDWLDTHARDRFFLFIHTYDVHSRWRRLPYECPGDYYDELYSSQYDVDFDGCRNGLCATKLLTWVNSGIREGTLRGTDFFTTEEIDFISALYDGCINYVDDRIRRLLKRLKRLAIYDRSLIIVTSDHGEEFLEHGMLLHEQPYEEIAHIPLIIKLPGSEYGGRRVSHLAAMVDLMPTVLDVLEVPVNSQAQGTTLVPTIADDAPVRDAIHMYSVLRTDRYKYDPGRNELYDLASDPLERTNISAHSGELLHRFDDRVRHLTGRDEELHQAFQSRLERRPEPLHLTPDEIEDLRKLGYLQ
jgi:arylsulfatase A-like enzyme